MKKLLSLLGIASIITFLSMGCNGAYYLVEKMQSMKDNLYLSSAKLCYCVRVKNIGSKTIYIEDIQLYNSKQFSIAGPGVLLPGISGGSGNYYELPDKTLTINWRLLDGSKHFKTEVEVKVPPELMNKRLMNCIIFYMNPDTEKIYVAYEYEHKDGKYRIINSDGTPFDINKIINK